MFWKAGHRIIIANSYLLGGYECDLLTISKTELINEIEIKVSKADFKKDFVEKKYKHILLESKNYGQHRYRIPNYFWFAYPQNMVNEKDVPDYAGIICIKKREHPHYYEGMFDSFIVRRPKRLHKETIQPSFYKNLSHNLCAKYLWNGHSPIARKHDEPKFPNWII